MDLDMREKAVVNALRLVDGKDRNREQNFLRIVSDYRARVDSLKRLLARARPHVDAPLGTLAADIDLELNR